MNTNLHPDHELSGSLKLLMAHIGGNQGQSLLEMTSREPTLLVFLRHLGCVFCRQTLSDLRAAKPALSVRGISVALIHMATDRQAELVFRLYGMEDAARFSDPDRSLYEAFGLRRVTMRELMSKELFKRGFEACVRERHAMSVPRGDPMQMPGVFLLDRGSVAASFIHEHPWDRPRYEDFAQPGLGLRAAS